MGSQIPSLALSAHNAGVSSNPPCWVSPQPAHGKLLPTHYSERKELLNEPVSSRVTTQYMPVLQELLWVLLPSILPTRYSTLAPGEVPGLTTSRQTTEYLEGRH